MCICAKSLKLFESSSTFYFWHFSSNFDLNVTLDLSNDTLDLNETNIENSSIPTTRLPTTTTFTTTGVENVTESSVKNTTSRPTIVVTTITRFLN
mgnify:FL=1